MSKSLKHHSNKKNNHLSEQIQNIEDTPKPIYKSIYEEYFDYCNKYTAIYGEKTCVLLEVGSFFEIYTYKNIYINKQSDNLNEQANKRCITNEIQHPNCQEISKFCNLNLVEKKQTYQNENQIILMMGFRNYMMDKYVQKLTDANYTVVVYIQEKKGKEILRKLHNIYSKGTFLTFDTEEDLQNIQKPFINNTNYILCIWIKICNLHSTSIISTVDTCPLQTPNIQKTIVYGVSAINICTGYSTIFEYETPYLLTPTTFDELERFVLTFPSNEVIFIAPQIDKQTSEIILKYAGVQCNLIHFITQETINLQTFLQNKIKNCEKQVYINTILNTYFNNTNAVNTNAVNTNAVNTNAVNTNAVNTNIDLNILSNNNMFYQCEEFQKNTIATQSFCYLLEFIKEHNCDLIRKIAIPTFTNTSFQLILANHTLRQLNIIDDNNIDIKINSRFSSVLSFTNRCKTAIGRRVFQRQLLSPTFNETWLLNEYNKISDILVNLDSEKIEYIRKMFGQMRDIEKITRQLILRKLYPSHLYHLYETILILENINIYIKDNWANTTLNGCPIYENAVFLENVKIFKNYLEGVFFLEVCKKTNSIQVFEENIIAPLVSIELDSLIKKQKNTMVQLNDIHKYLNQLIQQNQLQHSTEYIKIHETDKSGFSFQITKKRAKILKQILTDMQKDENLSISSSINASSKILIPIKDIHIISCSTTNDEITFQLLSNICKIMHTVQDEINEQIYKEYMKILNILENEWYNKILNFIKYIGDVDVLINKAYIAKKYNYCCPKLYSNVKDESNPSSFIDKSFIRAKNMRHCLIEHIQTSEIYVANDIHIGCDNQDGILLYGTNAIGKTSFIRSIGICVVLAQAGMFVPCDTFEYKPYHSIFSRIIGNDNLFKNMSTFQVEMSELRIILKHGDENSLILGDEVCSSTELESGLSIITATLIELHKRNSSFIFATHFHEILHFEEIKNLTNLQIKHLEVQFDAVSGKLVYNRKLKEGVGVTSYGLTVCKSLNMPIEFMEKAIEIRNRHYPINGNILSYQQSKYNSNKLVGICENCKMEFSSEIHHIHPQKNSIQNGYINSKNGSFHKNHIANLQSLCENCHKKMHN
jgi:DNA mismatch repair protein MutS